MLKKKNNKSTWAAVLLLFVYIVYLQLAEDDDNADFQAEVDAAVGKKS